MMKSVMITGANGGLGKETARQLAAIDTTEKVYLACRNRRKAEDTAKSLQTETGRSIFEVVELDTSVVASARAAVASLDRPLDGLVMNAGGIIGVDFGERTAEGVTRMLAVNLLGHAVLLEELLAADKLRNVAIFSGSETARGVKTLGLKPPSLHSYSVDEFTSVCDGSFFKGEANFMVSYQYVKFMGALYMGAMSRRHPGPRLLTVSPGSTMGTEIYDNAPPMTRFMLKVVTSLPIKSLRERNFHGVEVGAKRYVDALINDAYRSGHFYASKGQGVTGPLVDQGEFFSDVDNEQFQDNAWEALHGFVS